MAEFDGGGEMIDGGFGGGGDGGGGGGQMPGESMEDYIARLKKSGMFGGDITDQPQVGGSGVIVPGTTAGIGAGAAGTNQGTTSGLGTNVGGGKGPGGFGKDGTGTGEGGSYGAATVAEPVGNNNRSYSGSGGGGATIPGGTHTTFQWPTGSSDKGPATQKGGAYPDTWNTPMSRPENAGMNNFNMLAYLLSLRPQYVQPAYKNQLNPFTAGSMAAGQAPMSTNYLSRLTGGTR